ncbi:MAG: protease inhibitor I42 family protein [Dehalococcoidia bacterium]|nr:protease inhibitor I42 family protein [Dehalococcoidia bacterium]
MAPENTDMVGAPGKEVWTFEALEKGSSTISMEYSQPWEGGEKAAQTFSLTVVVK